MHWTSEFKTSGADIAKLSWLIAPTWMPWVQMWAFAGSLKFFQSITVDSYGAVNAFIEKLRQA
jgi:hypothetical protein